MAVEVTLKKFVAIPRDAFDCLGDRHATFDEAAESGSARCAEDGMAVYVVELKAVVSRADKPVKVRKL